VDEVERLGLELALLGRVATRTPPQILEEELGAESAERVRRAAVESLAVCLRHEEVSRRMVAQAEEVAAPVIFLKGMALHISGLSEPGSRTSVDIDVLVPTGSLRRLNQRLLETGCQPTGLPDVGHHLPQLRHPLGSLIELHRYLSGVRFGEGQAATGEACLELGLCRAAPGLPEGSFVPTEELLQAHLLAHALGQHGLAPESYALLATLADLQDLSVAEGGAEGPAAEVLEWLSGFVPVREVAAVFDLLDRLAAGDLASRVALETSDAGLLLGHMLAGLSNPEYQDALKLTRVFDLGAGAARRLSVAGRLMRALWPTRQQLDLIYGRPPRRLGYVRLRLWRPFDLIRRTCRSAIAAARLERRQPDSGSKDGQHESSTTRTGGAGCES
jgi:hypothetical protein